MRLTKLWRWYST